MTSHRERVARKRRQLRAASGGGPASVSSLVAWLDADTTTGFGTVGFTVPDKATSGEQANNGTQAVVVNQPNPGTGVFVFDGSNDFLTVANGTDLQWTAGGAYIVKFNPGGTPASDRDIYTHWGADERMGLRVKSSGNVEWIIAIDQFTFATAILGTADIDLSQTNVLTCIFNGAGTGNAGKAVMRVNGSPKTLSFSGTIPSAMRADATATVLLGSFNAIVNPYIGAIEHLMVCNAVPSAADLLILEAA